jgi:hypothetical protein
VVETPAWIQFGQDVWIDLATACSHERLEINGIGEFASLTMMIHGENSTVVTYTVKALSTGSAILMVTGYGGGCSWTIAEGVT